MIRTDTCQSTPSITHSYDSGVSNWDIFLASHAVSSIAHESLIARMLLNPFGRAYWTEISKFFEKATLQGYCIVYCNNKFR